MGELVIIINFNFKSKAILELFVSLVFQKNTLYFIKHTLKTKKIINISA